MKVIYANIIWYVCILIGLGFAALNRHNSSDLGNMTDVRYNYDVLYGLLGIYLVVCIAGLLLKKRWGYSIAVTANAIFSLLPIGILLASLYMLLPDLSFIELLEINLTNIVVGVISLVFWVWLLKSHIKEIYLQKNM